MKRAHMGILTNDMMRVVNEQQLGFIATVCPNGTPNLSPKDTTAVWDDEHLVFADICSPITVANLLQNPVVEINSEGPQFAELLDFYQKRGSTSVKRHIVLVKVDRAAPLISPAYDNGQSEAQVTTRWRSYWEELWNRRSKLRTRV